MATIPDDDLVVLVVVDPSDAAQEKPLEEKSGEIISISAADVRNWDLPVILGSRVVKVEVNRNKLVQQASYFRGLLQGNFSESSLRHVPIRWNLETVISIIRFIYGCPVNVTSNNFLLLLQGALFFGAESLQLQCEAWLSEIASQNGKGHISVDAIIEIWNFSTEHGIDLIPKLCSGYIAQNFVQVTSCSSFFSIPYSMLCSCIEHPHLTVDSEKQLCEVLLDWLESNDSLSDSINNSGKDYINILKKIRTCLLPLGYAAGKSRSKYFSSIAYECVSTIHALVKDDVSLYSSTMGDVLDNFKIRLTRYSQKVVLEGCAQLKVSLLFLALLPSNLDVLKQRVNEGLIELDCHKKDYNQISQEFTLLSFDGVHHLDMSKCPKLQIGSAIKFLPATFPSLRVLKLSHCSNFKLEHLHYLIQKCSLLDEVDLTVDISPVVAKQASVLSSTVEGCQALIGDPCMTLKNTSLLSNITKLSFEGRRDLNDSELISIASLVGSLSYINLKGCALLTDPGIAKLICQCTSMLSIDASYTFFGRNSILALCSDCMPLNAFPGFQCCQPLNTMASRLQLLHLDACKGIDHASMQKLLSHAFMLESLSLRDTCLVDDALYEFRGASLESLDVSETMVSIGSLSHVIQRSSGLKSLKMSGCRNLHPNENGIHIPEQRGCTSYKDFYAELGQKCFLEEVAFGWGFSSFSLEKTIPAIRHLRSITVNMGASLNHQMLSALPVYCPLLESVIFNFQVISDGILMGILGSLRYLQVLGLFCCLGDLTSKSFLINSPSLRKLQLEWVSPWMTNDDLVILNRSFPNLVELSLSGCKLLDTDSQHIISAGWPGLTCLHLQDCGNVMADGAYSIFDCVALEDLLLRHSGRGIRKGFVAEAASKLPLLRKIALDLCDACESGFDSPSHADRCFLGTMTIARCKPQRCSFDLQRLGTFRSMHQETIVLEWNGKGQRTTIVKERL